MQVPWWTRRAGTKRSFPDVPVFGKYGDETAPYRMHVQLLDVLKNNLKTSFLPTRIEGGITAVKTLSKLMWDMDKCAVMKKLKLRCKGIVPTHLGCVGAAMDAEGKIGGKNKKKIRLDSPMDDNSVDAFRARLLTLSESTALLHGSPVRACLLSTPHTLLLTLLLPQ
jgi:hypothetical protein